MTALHAPPTSSSSSSKPSLHLSLAPSSSAPGTPSSSSISRRIGSWGSATSDTYHALQALGDESLTALPSPLDFDRDRREFGFLPSSSSSSQYGGGGTTGSGSDWQSGNWTRSTGRGRGNSVFEELRDGSIGGERPSNLGASTSSWLNSSLNGSYSSPTTNGTNTPTRAPSFSSGAHDRQPPERSKTLSFFGSSSISSSFGDPSSGALSPPPNPPSRSGSLKDSQRGGGGGHAKDFSGGSSSSGVGGSWASGGAASGAVGGWGAFPTPTPPPPLAPFPSSSSASALSSTAAHDPLRSSVASSSGGSWLDDAADEVGGGLWTRGRGGSIGSKSAAGVRAESPARYGYDGRDMETPSPVAALRPRLAALNTSTLSPPPSASSASQPSDGPLSTSTSSPSHHPLSSLPSAYPSDGPPPLSIASAASASRAARFLHLSSQQPHLPHLPQPDYPARSASVPLYSSAAFTPIHDSTPTASPQRQERVKKSSAASSSASATTSATTTPSRPSKPSTDDGENDADAPPLPQRGDKLGDFVVDRVLGKGAFSRVALARREAQKGKGRAGDVRRGSKDAAQEKDEVVALKLVARTACEGNERMRISVLREVEVLKNIHHPSLVSLSSTFTTPLYTVLVLDYCAGGELFDFLADWHAEISEGLARRMFGELCSAVGWMHEIGLVHRDIKLENILLTSRPFPTTAPPSALLSSLPNPFLKLTDFGLSRFINPSSPLLSTRCGSEAYAAPELIMGKKYDGRATDAWALGVVLFAIITGVMPFVEEPDAGPKGRRAYLLKIAKADYRWPGQRGGSRLSTASSSASMGGSSPSPTKSMQGFGHTPSSSLSSVSTSATSPPPTTTTFPRSSDPLALSLPAVSGPASSAAVPPSTRLVTPPVQSVVARLLVRDPAKRAKVDDLWSEEWMREGEGRVRPVRGVVRRRSAEAGAGMGEEDEGWARRGSEVLE
ncbi:hypothetical protein JCM6882_008723 [Rhodosporidiobolus microsporus]